jgi:hypothetical protein
MSRPGGLSDQHFAESTSKLNGQIDRLYVPQQSFALTASVRSLPPDLRSRSSTLKSTMDRRIAIQNRLRNDSDDSMALISSTGATAASLTRNGWLLIDVLPMPWQYTSDQMYPL